MPHVKFQEYRHTGSGEENRHIRSGSAFLARLREVHRAIAVTQVVHVPVPVRVRVTLALKFSRSPYLDNHSLESIHTWAIDTLYGSFYGIGPLGPGQGLGLEVKI